VSGATTLGSGTSTVAPLKFTSGTNLTTAAAGACEYDGSVFYYTPNTSNRGVVAVENLLFQEATYTLTSQTAAQKLFNASTNGTLTLPVGTYEFECLASLSSLSATLGNFGFAFGGTATFTQYWQAIASKPVSLATGGVPNETYNTAANTALATASTGTVGQMWLKGTIIITVAGTIIPQASLTVATAAVVGVGSYFKIKKMSATTASNFTVGNWS